MWEESETKGEERVGGEDWRGEERTDAERSREEERGVLKFNVAHHTTTYSSQKNSCALPSCMSVMKKHRKEEGER